MTTREEILDALARERCQDCGASEGEAIEYGSQRWDRYATCESCMFTQKSVYHTNLITLKRPWRIRGQVCE